MEKAGGTDGKGQNMIMETDAVFICREVNRQTGQIAVYKLDEPFSGKMAFYLKIRQQYNPELRYYCAGANFYEEYKEEIFSALKKRNVLRENIEKLGAIIELGR